MTAETPHWFKSHSSNGGACVEVATNLIASHGTIPVRDSKNPNGPHLTLSADAWSGLVEFARHAAI
ncbi:DUF397 domain-containing protein [Streptomyces sp. Ac-502]|uniref:DUF397 domain-containing protein n=1 Tax=Streptomyces sp. Ac-502 TaxID=3342801 RepID=UPI003862ADB0